MHEQLSAEIDMRNNTFTSAVKARILSNISAISTESLEWLVMEHYQFSSANTGFLRMAVECTDKLANPGVPAELQRNADEENGHAQMYKQAMLIIGTDMDQRAEFPPTTQFLASMAELCAADASRTLGALYATETAAIFEHEVFFEICREVAERRGFTYQGSLIKRFHDIHLDDGVEQGHKDGLAQFVDLDETGTPASGAINRDSVLRGAMEAIEVMKTWWAALLGRALGKPSAVGS